MRNVGVAYIPAVCVAVAVGTGIVAPTISDAKTVQCSSSADQKMTVVDGRTACGTEADQSGQATGYGMNGIGYAKGTHGANAFGIGVDGGVGASQGVGGIPAAVGIGANSVAITSVDDGSMSIAVAMNGSQALVANANQGVLCQGNSALAWNASSGAACLATVLGTWRVR